MPILTSDQKDRSITIQATPTLHANSSGQITSVTFAYEETASDPNMQNVVNETTGDINLSHLPSNSRYTDNVDILINLVTPVTGPQGLNYDVRFATTSEGNGPIWFCAVPPPGGPKDPTPIPTPSDMSIGANSSTQVYLNDDQADGGSSYCFCMAVVVPSVSATPFTIDPIITGKGGSNSFMLSD